AEVASAGPEPDGIDPAYLVASFPRPVSGQQTVFSADTSPWSTVRKRHSRPRLLVPAPSQTVKLYGDSPHGCSGNLCDPHPNKRSCAMLIRLSAHRRQSLLPYRPALEKLEDRCLLSFNEFPIPTPASDPNGITTGPDGNLWFCEDAAGQIGVLTPSGQFLKEIPLPSPDSMDPDSITVGPDGYHLWFTEDLGNRI